MQKIMLSDYPLMAAFLNYQTQTYIPPSPIKYNCKAELGKQ